MRNDPKVPLLTLDTSVILELLRNQKKVEVMRHLVDLERQGKVNLMVTARIHEDVPRDPLASRLRDLPALGVHEGPSVTRFGYWVLGRDLLGDDKFKAFSETATAKMSGKKRVDWRDWDHLHSHYLQRRDYFLTWDQGILSLAAELAREFRIKVLTPESFLEQCSQIS